MKSIFAVSASLLVSSALAETNKMTILPSAGTCPADIIFETTARQYEGGFETSGTLKESFAWKNIRLAQRTANMLVFVADVDTGFIRNCEAEAALVRYENDLAVRDPLYKARVTNNRFYFKIDLSSFGENAAILSHEISGETAQFKFAIAD